MGAGGTGSWCGDGVVGPACEPRRGLDCAGSFTGGICRGWRRGGSGRMLSKEQAFRAFGWFEKCAPKLYEVRPLLPGALKLSLEYDLSVQDCCSLAVAVEFGWPVLTADMRLYRARRWVCARSATGWRESLVAARFKFAKKRGERGRGRGGVGSACWSARWSSCR